MEFQLSWYMKIPFDYDNKDYYQFKWMYDRLVKKINEKNNSGGGSDGNNLLDNPALMQQLNDMR